MAAVGGLDRIHRKRADGIGHVDLGSMVDTKAREAGGSAGGLNESRQLLFAALLLADQLNEANGGAAMVSASRADR
jgi:hypothetical protein